MYVLVFVDKINYSYGPTSIDWTNQVCKVSNTVAKLKKYTKKFDNNSGSIVKWIKNVDGQWIGQVYYKDKEERKEPDQYYMIIKIGQIK